MGPDLCCDGRSVPPLMTYGTACSGKGLLSCELLGIPTAAVAGILLNVHKIPTSSKSRRVDRGHVVIRVQTTENKSLV